MDITDLLNVVVKHNASDLHLRVNRPPSVRITGKLRSLNLPPLEPSDTVAMMKSITSEKCQQELQEVGGSDFGFAFGNVARFRVSVFKERGNIGLALRLLPNKLMTFEEIGLPPVVKDICLRPRGMFLVTGPTGSGKTTTLATMLDFINQETPNHIVTVEDPIEYYHGHKKCIVTQREIGNDVPGFAEALRRGLRQDPDVILVGEMRDLETIQAAITAAETGHLVFGTLHTTGSANTISRIIDAFPTDRQEQVRTQLADVLEAVISQTLCPTIDGNGRVAAFEIMFNNFGIKNLIRENKVFRINSSIQTGGKQGMILLDDFLFDLWNKKQIDFNEMMRKAQDSGYLQDKVRVFTEEQQKRQKK